VEVPVADGPSDEYPPGKPAPGELRPREIEYPEGRLSRLWKAAARRHIPLPTIVVTVAVVAATYLAGKLIYRIRELVVVILVAGFVAVLLNPLVVLLQRHVFPRRGIAVAIVTLLAVLVFIALAVAFGYPLVNGITHLANAQPSYVASAEHGRDWYGRLVTKYHIQNWVQRNAPKLASYGAALSKPALSIGKGALSLVIEIFTLFILVLLLGPGPAQRNWPGELSGSPFHTTATISAGSITAHPVSRSRWTRPSGRTSTPVSFLFSAVGKAMGPTLVTSREICPDLPMRGLSRSRTISPVMNRTSMYR
jgi:hypothetical protein